MQKFIVSGGRRLRGELALQGSKNSALPIMAAALMCRSECVLTDSPKLTDVYAAARLIITILSLLTIAAIIAGLYIHVFGRKIKGSGIFETR